MREGAISINRVIVDSIMAEKAREAAYQRKIKPAKRPLSRDEFRALMLRDMEARIDNG